MLRKKAEELQIFTLPTSSQYSSKGDLRECLNRVLPILDQFIRTYEGEVDNDFCDIIFDYTKVGMFGGSGYVINELRLFRLLLSVHF